MATVHRHKLTLKAHLTGVSTGPGSEPTLVTASPARPNPVPPPPAAAVSPPPSQAKEQPREQPKEQLDPSALQHITAELARLIEASRSHEAQRLHEVGRLSVELATTIAERLLGAEIVANRQRLDTLILGALQRLQAMRAVAVHGHPNDLALLQRQLAAHPDQERLKGALTYRPDEAFRRGQWKLETDEWFVEWDTARSLAEVRAALLEATLKDE